MESLLKNTIETKHPKRVLDLGSGKLFSHSIEMAGMGLDIDAIEPDARFEGDLPSNIHFFQVKAEDFDYKDDEYDLIVFRMVAQFLDRNFVEKLFSEIFPKTLKSGGNIFFVVPGKYEEPGSLKENFNILELSEYMGKYMDGVERPIRAYILENK